MKKHIFHIIIWLITTACSVSGQVMTNGFEGVINNKVNNTGSAVTYYKILDGKNTFIVDNLRSNTQYNLDNIHSDCVLSRRFFIGMDFKSQKIHLIDLEYDQYETIEGVSRFWWNEASQKIIYSDDTSQKLTVYDLIKKNKEIYFNITQFSVSTNAQLLVALEENKKWFVKDIEKSETKTYIKNNIKGVKKLKWNGNSIKELYFFSVGNNTYAVDKINKKHFQRIYEGAIKQTNAPTIDSLFTEVIFLKNEIAMNVLPNKVTKKEQTTNVQVLLGKSNRISFTEAPAFIENQYVKINLKKQIIKHFPTLEGSKQWIHPTNGELFVMEPTVFDDFSLFEPKNKGYFWDENLNKKQFFGLLNGNERTIHLTVKFPYLLYFFKNDWYYYNHFQNRSINITAKISDVFYNEQFEYAALKEDETTQNFPLFNNHLIFYGATDLWGFDIDKKSLVSLTHGTQKKRSYELPPTNYTNHSITNNNENIINFNNLLVQWKSVDLLHSGISVINESGIEDDFVEGTFKISQISRSKDYFTYVKEKFNRPPALYLYDMQNRREKLIYQTNTWDSIAKELKVEYKEWINQAKQKYGAVVRYPLNYDESKKYPAVFKIYEKRKKELYTYYSLQDIYGSGINPRLYNESDYFVIEPDIYFEIGKVGSSVVTAINETLHALNENKNIDTNRLGLYGHSFGGYETNFAITQTDVFRAAVASAGVSDLVNYYHNYSEAYLKPDLWRVEKQQWRMGTPFHEKPSMYIENSPIMFLNQVTTPLLLLSGKEDYVIDYRQSLNMFIGLRRLGKEVNLLLYPNEGHVIHGRENKIDASKKIKNWFDYYLKDSEKPIWMKEGLN